MNILIVGLGVVGGSYAKALHRAGYRELYGVDPDLDTLQAALAEGVLREASPDPRALLPGAELIVLAIYPHDVARWVRTYAPLCRPGAFFTDATGVKGALVDEVLAALPPGVDFVFGHPMAGREKKGYAYASHEVFLGANYLLTPTPHNDPAHLDAVERLAREMGFARVTRIDPHEHDRRIAFTSQLTHAIAVALVNSDEAPEETARFIGDSYRDLTRIAKINPALWSELFLSNRDNLVHMIDGFQAQLNALRQAVQAGDADALIERFEQSALRRAQLDA